jgi:hypothetical protein
MRRTYLEFSMGALDIALIIVGVIVGLIVLVLTIAAMSSASFRIERSADINSPAWQAWSPWEKLDPELERTYSGNERGVGAIYEWLGNKKVGQGRMEITESVQPARVTIQLDFIKPFEAHNKALFTVTGSGASTNVNWAMEGSKPFLFKVMTLFMSLDKMIGKDFERGLANMKEQAEK